MRTIRFTEATDFHFDIKKSIWLREERGFGFEEIIHFINQEKFIDVFPHPNPNRSHQFICEIVVDDYVYIVPFVIDGEKVFLKTMFPSRKATRKRKTGDKK